MNIKPTMHHEVARDLASRLANTMRLLFIVLQTKLQVHSLLNPFSLIASNNRFIAGYITAVV